MRNNSIVPDNFAEEVVKVTYLIGLWNALFLLYSPSVTHLICLKGLEHSLGIHGLKPTCRIVEILATRVKFLQPSGYSTVTNFTFTFRSARHVSAPAIMTLPFIPGTYHGLYCFSHLIHTLHTNTYYQNIAKHLILSSSYIKPYYYFSIK